MEVLKIALNDVLPILYCLSTDNVIDFYLLPTVEVACKDILSYSENINTFADELDVDVTKQQILNVTVNKRNSY